MNILHIDTERGWRGGQNQVKLLCEGLTARGDAHCHLAALAGGELGGRVGKGVKIVPLASGRGWQPITARRLAQYCRKNKIKIVHAHSSHAHDLGLLIKVWAPELKLVVHRRVDYAPANNFVSNLKYRSSKVDKFVCVSHAIARVLEGAGVAAARVATVHSAVEKFAVTKADLIAAKRSEILREVGGDLAAPLLVNVAALTEQKDHATLLRALARVKAAGVKFTCVIAGDGELRAELDAQRRAAGLGDCVHLLGYRKDARELIAAGDAFVLSSEDEGLGTVLLDAALAKRCIIATAVGGIPEIVIDGQTGLLAGRAADQGLAQLLQLVITDPALRQRLGEQAYTFVDQNFSVKNMVAGNLKIYLDLLK